MPISTPEILSVEEVRAERDNVVLADMVEGRSTAHTLERIVKVYGRAEARRG